MKIGILCSSGGSAFFSAYDILYDLNIFDASNFYVVTDRDCMAEKGCIKRGIEYFRIEDNNISSFCEKAHKLLSSKNISTIFLYFLRVVTNKIHHNFATLNLHPSLLPSFSGFQALNRAKKAGCKFVGCTLHLAIEETDSGQIIGQVVSPIKRDIDSKALHHISYLQKTYLTLCGIDMLRMKIIEINALSGQVTVNSEMEFSCSANPTIFTKEIRDAFNDLQRKSNMEIIL